MTQPLTFEEWKEKHNVVDTSQLANNIAKTYELNSDGLTEHLNNFLYTDYKLYLYRLQNSDCTLKNMPDNWEELVDMSGETK